MEYCKNCGALLTAGLVYCVNCGVPVANVDDDDGPETVVNREVVIPQPVVEPPPAPIEPQTRNTLFVVLAAIAATSAVIAVAIASYMLGRQTAVQQARTDNSANTGYVVPDVLPSPLPSPTPTPVAKDSLGHVDCTVNEKAQLHDDCDKKDCDNDASTVAFGIAAGTPISKLGISRQNRKYRWEKISMSGKEAWIASTKLDCTAGLTTADAPAVPNAPVPKNVSNRITASKPDPWRAVLSDVRAICNDGTYSYTGTHFFQCTFHKGVKIRR